MARPTARTEASPTDATPRRNARRAASPDAAPARARSNASRRTTAGDAERTLGDGRPGNRRIARAIDEVQEREPHESEAQEVGFIRRALGSARDRLAADRPRLARAFSAVGRALLVVLALAGCAAVGRLAERHVRTSPAFAIRALTVEGTERLTEAEVLRAAGLAIGENVFAVPPEDVHARLVRHPWIAEATVRRRLPGTFELAVRERRPAASILLDRLYLVGQDASVFKVLEAGDPVDLPVVTGVDLARFTSDRAFRSSTLLEVVALLHDFGGAGLSTRVPIEEIHFERDGSLSLYLGTDATYVRLGHAPYQTKLRRLRRVFDELARRDAEAAYVYLDNVRRPDRVTVRLRETPEPASVSTTGSAQAL